MSYKRRLVPSDFPQGAQLTAALVGIGMNFAAKGQTDPNIEDTLVAASIEGLARGDLRVLDVLVTWLGVHSPWINVDRLYRSVALQEDNRVRAFWAAVAMWRHKDRRFSRCEGLYRGPRQPLLPSGNAFQVRRHGEDKRFAHGPLEIPAEILRGRTADVLSPAELAKRHRTYRQRILMGPSYRADMWAELERNPDLSAAELARQTYGSFATAWQIKQDWALLQAA